MKTSKTQFVKDLRDQDRISSPFLIKSASMGTGKTGKPFMSLVLQDKSGELDARIWDNVSVYANQVVRDALVLIEGQVQTYQGRLQVVIRDLSLLREDEVNLEDLVIASSLDAEKLHTQLCQMIRSMSDPFYRALCESVLIDDAAIVASVKRAPAAKSVHHAYPVGLLEHMVSVCSLLDGIAKHYGQSVNRDLLLVGGLFHDLAKIWELQYEKTTDYTTEGRLLGHLVMGVELIEKHARKVESEPGRLPGKFPEEHLLLAKHMVVAHHGKLEYGSPKEPACVEALIVHMVDDLDSKVNQIVKFVEADVQPGAWTSIHRHFERYFFKPVELRKS